MLVIIHTYIRNNDTYRLKILLAPILRLFDNSNYEEPMGRRSGRTMSCSCKSAPPVVEDFF